MILTTAIIKGGTGKSTTTAAIAQAAAIQGKKVLCVDMDPQGNLTYILGGDTALRGSLELLNGQEVTPQQTASGVDLYAASVDLSAEVTRKGSVTRLSKALEGIKRKYALIVIDTPPTLGELTYNALYAADEILIPMTQDAMCMHGAIYLANIADQIRQSNGKAHIVGAIVNMYKTRGRMKNTAYNYIVEQSKINRIPLLGNVREAAALQEAQSLHENLYSYAPKCNPALDYMKIYERIAKRRAKK